MSLVAHALCTVDELKTWLRMETYTFNEGVVMEQVINYVTERFEDETGRHILNASRATVERLDGTGVWRVNLRRFPVISVSELLLIGPDGATAHTYTVSGTAIYVTDSGLLMLNDQVAFPEGRANIKATYLAGWATVPNDVKVAALQWCADIWRAWAKEREPIESISIGNQTTVFFNEAIPKKAQAVVDRYRIAVGAA